MQTVETADAELSAFERSVRDCQPGRPYIVPNRKSNPLGRFWELPMREYQLYFAARERLGSKIGHALAVALQGNGNPFDLLDDSDRVSLGIFLEDELITFEA